MKWRKILSICLVGAMAATLMAGCGGSDEKAAEEKKDNVETAVEDVEDASEEAAEDVNDVAEEAEEDAEDNAGGGNFTGFDDTITIKAYGFSAYVSEGLPEVVDAINAISVPAINVELDFTPIDLSSYSEQIGLMFAGAESFDLFLASAVTSTASGFLELQANNELMDISEYVYEYAPETMALLGEFTDPLWVDGGLYALPVYRIYNSNEYIIMRKDILDYLGLTEKAEAISSWSDFEVIMETVQDAQDSLPEELQTPYMISAAYGDGEILAFNGYDNAADDFSDHYGFDTLSDSNYLYKVDDGTVTCWYESEDYQTIINRVRDWYLKGWVDKDAANNLEIADLSLKDGASFSYMQHSEVGVESAKRQSTGYDVICVETCGQPIQTGGIINIAWGVPITSSEPEAAVAFLNLMYTNADIVNLFDYGIEGRDYEINDEGEAVILDGSQYQGADYLNGNQFLAYPSEGEGGDFRKYSHEIMMDEELSPYFGFTIDLSPVDNESAAVAAVVRQYAPALNSGTIDASETYDEFIDSLYDAGMQTLLDYYQESLDAWMAKQ